MNFIFVLISVKAPRQIIKASRLFVYGLPQLQGLLGESLGENLDENEQEFAGHVTYSFHCFIQPAPRAFIYRQEWRWTRNHVSGHRRK